VRGEQTEAFEQLCRDEYPRLVRTAFLITGDREESLDLAQEALARAYERWPTVSRLDWPGAWLCRVVANLAISWRRRRRVRERTAVQPPQTNDAIETSDPDLIASLKALPPAQRAAVVLRFYADLSVKETARALGKRPGTVRALTSQGIAKLRRTLPGEVYDES
jgi:RNA polymerase sigma-70 factor (sigma-E family)